MRVLYFSRTYTTHDRLFLGELAGSAHDVWFLRLAEDEAALDRRPLPDGVQTVALRSVSAADLQAPESMVPLVPALERVIDEVGPDLVQAGPVQSCGFMAALAGFHPLMVMSWGSDVLVDACRDEVWRWATKYTLERADALVADCMAVRDKAREFAPFEDSQVVLLPWGVDLGRFRPGTDSTGLRARLAWQDSFVVLSTRSWEPVYNVETVVEAFAMAREVNPSIKLILVGDGALSPRIAERIAERGLDSDIHRPGRVSHDVLPEYFRASDIYLSSALSDGSSVSLMEAMATGLPAIVTDAPGNREWVTLGENGWLAPAHDGAAFADRILAAAELGAECRGQMGIQNRQTAEARADWSSNVKRLTKAYDEIEGRIGR